MAGKLAERDAALAAALTELAERQARREELIKQRADAVRARQGMVETQSAIRHEETNVREELAGFRCAPAYAAGIGRVAGRLFPGRARGDGRGERRHAAWLVCPGVRAVRGARRIGDRHGSGAGRRAAGCGDGQRGVGARAVALLKATRAGPRHLPPAGPAFPGAARQRAGDAGHSRRGDGFDRLRIAL